MGDKITTYVFIDTNIFVRYLSQGREGCEPQHWKQVVSEVQTGTIRIVLPEIVKLELEKQSRVITQKIETSHITIRKQLQQTLESQIKSTETEDMRESLLSYYDTLHNEKLKGIRERYKYLQSELSHRNVREIPLSIDILLASKRRHLSGRLAPTSEKPNDADCGIIESLASYFAITQEENVRLLFCSENTDDFATQLEDKSWALHSTIRSALPDGLYFTSLKGLCECLTSTKPVEPPKSEELAAAEHNQEKARIERLANRRLSELKATHAQVLNELYAVGKMIEHENDSLASLKLKEDSLSDILLTYFGNLPESHPKLNDTHAEIARTRDSQELVKRRLDQLYKKYRKLKEALYPQ